MKTLIVENEIYLAQSIAAKLVDHGCRCDIATTVKDALKSDKYDVVLLSTSMSGQNFMSVVEYFKNAIIILMVSYVNNDTVSSPLKAGAKDYIMKPFMIEELINKIKHYSEFDKIKLENELMKEFVRDMFSSVVTPEVSKKIDLPLMVVCPTKKYADAYAYRLIASKGCFLKSIKLDNLTDLKSFKNLPANVVLYLQDFDQLKKSDKQSVIDAAMNINCIIYTSQPDTNWTHKSIQLEQGDSPLGSGDVLTVEDYVKSVLEQFQDKYPDIELAKKLGISRKSLWEKRKKHGINKKK